MQTRLHLRSRVLIVLLSLLVTAGPAVAFVAPEDGADFAVPLPVHPHATGRSKVASAACRSAVERMVHNYDGDWRVYATNPLADTPRWVYGSGVPVGGSFAEAQDVVDAGRSVIRDNPEVFHVGAGSLRYSSFARGAGKWAVRFQQTYRMLDVHGAVATLVFTDRGGLFLAGSTCHPRIDVDCTPRLSVDQTRGRAHADLTLNPATDRVEERPKLMILPVPAGEQGYAYHLVYRVRVDIREPRAIWVTYVDAHDGQIVWRYNDVQFVDLLGTTQAEVERPTYCSGLTPEALPYLRIQVSGLPGVNADAAGSWRLVYGGVMPRTVLAGLRSAYVEIRNAGGPAQAAFSGLAIPGAPLAIRFTDLNAQRDERDVYRAINDVHTYFQTLDPEFAYANQSIIANVSLGQTCNAYWDGTINFYRAGGGCANTGQMMDVVQHEFGHGVQNYILGGQQGDEGLGEGNSDILANLMQMSPIIGSGFALNRCPTGIRNSANTLRYPQDVWDHEIHLAGQVIAGFQWDAMEAMIAELGPEAGRLAAARAWHYGRLLAQPTRQEDQVMATFMGDDDDGNLLNGTPHYEALCQAAFKHGFECPEVFTGVIVQHAPLANRVTRDPIVVSAVIHSTEGALLADSVRVVYRVNGGSFQSVVMLPAGGPDEYAATIPGFAPPAQIEYYLRARDVAGNTKCHPARAPAVMHAFDVATQWEDMESENGWTVDLEGSERALSGQWVRLDPTGTGAQTDDDHSLDPGTVCWVTGNAPAGSLDGAADVDGGTTALYSPVYDLTGSGTALAKYWRWYSNDKGGAPSSDAWVVAARNNGGAWVTVENTVESSNSWVVRVVDLVAAFGEPVGLVQLKFVASDLGDPSLVEAALDDFEILAQLDSIDGAPAISGPARFALHGARPNPSLGSARITFEVPGAVRIGFGIHDVTGRLVRTFDGSYPAGTNSLEWDGRDGNGRQVPAGVYYVRMRAEEFRATRSLVLER